MKQNILDNLKNIYGWKTKRKIVVISVDDYGNVRLASKEARDKMNKAGLKLLSRYDSFDTLETREDLEILYNTLSTVKDKNGRYAIFTPFALPCNIDFERMEEENYAKYQYELLPITYSKLEAIDHKAYENTWDLWKEGINMGIMVPQFHGREHLNVKVLEEKLANKDKEVLTALKNRSYTSISNSGYDTIKYTAAFDFSKFNENEQFDTIIRDGLNAFEKVYGYRSIHFNPPGATEHSCIHRVLKESGIKYLDAPLIKKEHQGGGVFKNKINYTGKKNKLGMICQVRNVVFEPSDDRGIDWVSYAMRQIETAFRWNKPAIISSHRVNFCGHIDPKNREIGINALKELLHKIVKKWPDVEFMAANELGDLISNSNK